MKKIFTHLFALFLLSLVTTSNVWAQETTEITVTPSEGSYSSTGWSSSWTSSSSSEYLVTISVGGGVNNLNAATTSSGFQMARGSNADSDWTFSVAGYKVVSYSFKFKSAINNQDVTLSATNADGTAVSITSSYSEEKTFSIDCSNASTATFRISGENYSIIATDLTLTVREPLALTSLEVGQVYRFINVLYPTYSLNANSATDVNAVTTNETDTKQQWYVEKQDGEYYVLRNLAYGKFLKGNGQSSAWSMSDDYSHDYNKFKLYTSNTDYNTLHTNTLANYAYIHCNSSYNIVGWSNGTTDKGSHWEITKVDYTAEEITALLETAPTVAEVAAYPAALEAIFSDAACTILNSAYTTTSMTDEQLVADANYSALPQTLKNMVKKVRGGNWAEETVALDARPNGNNSSHGQWDVYTTWEHDYAKKFRVQMYEPYSVEGEITSFLGINAHCNMDNPTGIYANAGEPIYIMVEGDIAEGAELWVAHQTGHGVTEYYNNAAYTQLKKGLNVIPYASDGCQLWINYLVHTYNTSTGEFPHKLSDYKPLKIHIEGGHINGFFNAMGDFRSTEVTGDANGGENLWGEVDNDADWDYYKARVALATDFALLGHRQTLLFPFGTWNSSNGYFGVANEGGGIEKALAWHLENIEVPTTPNCYVGSGTGFGNYSDTYYPGMQLNATTGKINIMLEAWDRIMYSEHATMGLLSQSNIDKMNDLYPGWASDGTPFDIYNYGSNDTGDTYKAFCEGRDYGDYYNHHGAAVGSPSGYMSGGWRVCNYHYNTMGSIIGKIAVEAGPTWGPAHEIGHQHQKIFNLNGQTEVTNNFFSNVAVWYMGMGTSRVNGTEGSLASVLDAFNTEDNDLYTNNIWAITHLYYRLWLYYHLAGNNTQFWPRLFELLRQTPMVNGGQISGETSLLRFYQHACDAAGEDLTEFFRAHGFFEIMDNRFVGDYSNATYNITQEQIDAAIKSVKDKGYPVNYAVLLINDGTEETTVKHDGTTPRALWDSEASAEYGSVTDFINGNVSVETTYTATLNSDGTLTMSDGKGGVGFLVLNEDGEIVSFSNKSTFAISDEAAYLLATGKASVVTVDTESTTTEAEVDVTAMRFALLQELIENAIALTQNTSETRVGFYKPSAVTNLQDYVTMAQEVVDNGDLANLQAVYELLYAEYNAVVANEFSRVTFVPGSKYAILAKTNDRRLSFSDTNVVTVANTENYVSTANNQWYVERDGAFHIKNAGNSKYIQNVTDQNGVLYTVGDEVVNMNINEIQLGCYSIATSTVPGRYMNMDGANNARVITWGDTGNNSQWKFILLEENETNAAKEDLLELAKKTLALVDVVGTVEYTEGNKIELQSTNSGNANYIWSNAAVSGNDVDKLLDSDKSTFFHSQWNNSTAPDDGWGHHISVDLGTSSTLTSFTFKFTTRNQSNLSNYPKTIEVYGSNDNNTYTKLQVASGFATGAGVDNEAVVMGNGTPYRYLRFLVTDASGSNAGTNTGADGKVFFHMSEFSLYPITVTTSVKSDYTSVVTSDAVMNAFVDAEQAKSVYNNASATIDDINAKKTALGDGTAAGSYTTLLTQYNNVLNSVLEAKKQQLLNLIDETNTLIASVGSVTITPPAENELSLQVDNANGSYYLSTNSQESGGNRHIKNLVDGVTDSADSYFHTDWQTSVGADHHLLLDMGADNTLGTFAFKYTTRNNSAGIDAPKTIVVEGSNDNSSFTTIATLTGLPEGQHETYTSETLGTNQNGYRYIRFRVTDGAGKVGGSYYYFAMSEFDVTELTETEITVTNNSSVVKDDLLVNTYLATAKSQKLHDTATTVALLDAAIADQQAAYDALEKAKNTPADLDKAALQSLYGDALLLYNEMADTEGNVNTDYTPSALTNEKLIEVKAALDVAKEMLDNGISQTEIDAAKTTLQEQYDALLDIKNANVNLSGTFDKSELGTLITDAAALLSTINGKTENNSDYYAAAGIAIDELQDAYNAAVAAKDRFYLTEEQYTNVYNTLNSCYTTTNTVVIADVAGRDELTTLIANVKTLLGTIAEESAPKNVAVPLQSTTAAGDFYIWCNSPAGDDDGVAGLIDKNADGTANTGTFLGTSWGSTVAAYTHYIEVDLGEGITIDKLLFDYTTRNSTHSNQRPTAIKILGSNDKTDYTEITIISEGLATGQCQQWSMTETLELGAPYRYIRFAVATQESTGYFNMSDFNLYALIGHTRALKEYYTTAQGLDFEALCMALQSAEYAAEHYLTTDRLTEVKNMLNGYYTAANTIVEADVEAGDRTDLTDLVAETETLIEKVATVTEVEVTLTEGMLYCNADNSTNTGANASDRRGVAALLDGDLATHLHTTYGGNVQDDDLDHYIRVDLGDASVVTAFKFNYKGRQDNSNNAPTNMTVEAGNSIEAGAEWVTLATLSELPTGTAPVSYESELIEMSEAYRYVRFMVTDTYNHDTTTPSGGTAHKFFVMSEFGIEGYPTVEVDENYPRVTTALVRTAYNEKNSANNVATNYYMTENDYNAALAALQADYDALDAAATADKSELEALIEATTLLKGELYETVITSYTPNEVTLSATEGDAGWLYCNAAESNSTWATDNAGVAAAIDLTAEGEPNLDTFLHTEYGNDQSDDGLDHYLRVDLGADGATDYVEFGYYGRSGHLAKSPKKVIVAATNDLTDGGVWTEIATLNLAQASASTETKTGCLGNGVEYRYWRFLVEETHGGGKDGNNHQFFCMTEFNVYKCTDIVKNEQLKYSPAIYIYTTTELVTEVENAIAAATAVKDNADATQGDVDAEVEALQAVYDKLAEALENAGVPVEITTDEANPVLYNIISKRADDASKVLQFDEPTSDKVAIVATADNASYQAWYFMKGENGYLIKPFNGDGKMLGVSSTGDAVASASIAEAPTYKEWDFSRSTVTGCTDYFYIYVNGTSHACLSHNGGFNKTDKLGIWSGGWNTNDGGSLFKFVEAEFDNDNARYYQLSDFENTLEYQTADTPEGTTVGAFTNGDAYSTAYTTASTLITAGNTSATADCYNAYTALRTASENVERIEPEEGKIYRIYITPGLTDNRAGASMRIGDNGKLACGEYAAANTEYYFAFEYDGDGNLYMKNFHSGTYLDEALTSENNNNVPVGADAETIDAAKKIAINTLGKSGDAVVVGIVPDGGDMLNCAGKPGNVVAYDNTAVDKASAWVIEEVTDETVAENIKQSVTLNDSNDGNKYSTLYLGYNATIPTDVTASIVTGLNGLGQLVMRDVTEITGDRILPAKTAVVLSGTVDGAEFKYTGTDDEFDTSENVLKGTAYNKLVECGDNYNIYMLGKKNNRVAFYWAYENRGANGNYVYINANEEVVEENVEGAHKNHNKGGYVKCNANKAYLQMSEDTQGQAAAAMFSFYFGDGTSDIESVNAVADTYDNVYDLQGRKLEKVTSPGMYIVGGKKVYVTGVE